MKSKGVNIFVITILVIQIYYGCKKENENPDQQPVKEYSVHDLSYYYLDSLNGIEYFSSAVECSSGGYILTGYITLYEGNIGLVMRIDENGELIWRKVVDNFIGLTCIESNDHNYIISGLSTGSAQQKFAVIKIDEDGNIVWEKNYTGFLDTNVHNQIVENDDGDILIAGSQVESYDYTGYILKISSDGDSIWSSTFNHAPGHVMLSSIITTSDGGFAATGQVGTYYSNNTIILYKWNSAGELEWSKEFGEKMYNYGKELYEDNSGNLYILGKSDQANEDMNYAILIKTDQMGNKIFNKYFSTKKYDNLYPYDLTFISNGNFLITIPMDGNDIYGTLFIQTDANGNEIQRNLIDKFQTKKSIETASEKFAVFGEYNMDYFFFGFFY